MRRMQDIPIGRKLTLVIMLASCVALAVSSVAVITYDLATSKQHALADLNTRAEMVLVNAAAVLAFKDAEVANDVVGALGDKPEVISACLFNNAGEIFASYHRPDQTNVTFPKTQPDNAYFGNHQWRLFKSVKDKGDVLGTLYINYEVRPVRTRLAQYGGMASFVILALLAVYLFLSTALRRLISAPILSLVDTTRVITRDKNYRIRAPKHADDEIGHLTEAFNHMLGTIEARDQALQLANQELQQRGQQLQHELTERQRAQEALHQSEEQWRSLAENAPDTIMTLDREGTILFINRVLPGFKLEDVIGSRVSDYIRTESRDQLRSSLDRVFTTGENVNAELLGSGSHNELIWYSSRIGPIKNQGQVVAVTLILSDITERKLAETALRESEERYRRFFEEDLTGDYTALPSGKLLNCNPAFASIFAFSSVEEALRGNLGDLHPSAEVYQGFVERLRADKKLIYHEIQLQRLDTKPVFVIQNVLGTFDEHGELVEFKGYVFDITQHKQLEERYRQAFKMEAVGRLAGGIAHDFNNLLTAILGFSNILLEDLPPQASHREEVEQILKAAQQAASLTRQLLAYSRKQVLQAKVIDLNQVVSEVDKILRRLIGEDIELVTILEPSLGKVKADPSQMEQVIINLATNARDAMPNGGTLALETSTVRFDSSSPHPGAYVLLSIADTGCGMSAQVKAHLFEPFFTTKDIGKGTGLGLSTVYGIIKQSGGEIDVESESGRGTTFRIYLPAVPDVPERSKGGVALSTTVGGSETILLVEDEAGVRNLLRLVLEHHGYTVLEAQNGTHALQLSGKYRGPIHLLLTDLVMPQMSGRELAERLVQIRPNLKLLYMSGYTDDAVIRHGVLELDAAFLQKPFMPAALLEKVRQLLDHENRT